MAPAAQNYMNAAQAYQQAYSQDPEASEDEHAVCQQAGTDLQAAFNGYKTLLQNTTLVPGTAEVTITPGQFCFEVKEVRNVISADIPVTITLSVPQWYSTNNSFSPAGQLWTDYSPASFTLGGPKTVTVHKNGNAGKIRITAEAGNPVWKTITQDVDVPIFDALTEETLKTTIYTTAAESKDFIEDVSYVWQQVNNLVDGANGLLQTIPVFGDLIAGAVNTVKAQSAVTHAFMIIEMNDEVKTTFATQRNEVEKEYEKLQPGQLEDDDAALDIAQFNALY